MLMLNTKVQHQSFLSCIENRELEHNNRLKVIEPTVVQPEIVKHQHVEVPHTPVAHVEVPHTKVTHADVPHRQVEVIHGYPAELQHTHASPTYISPEHKTHVSVHPTHIVADKNQIKPDPAGIDDMDNLEDDEDLQRQLL
jgi:hypothetical protein